MLGTEPDIVANYVETGQVKIVFWPVLNHGNPSVYASLAAECVAQLDMDAFWEYHHFLFENQADLWRADRDYFVETAVSFSVDQAQFEACYDGPGGLDVVLALDDERRQRGIFSQPVFDVNGELLAGRRQFDVFASLFDEMVE